PRAGSMRTWCLCQICTCGFPSPPNHIPVPSPIQTAFLWDLTD
uniref:Uncharacterized protein n=1 Tax=Phocoena sinus TaxID=42100 RepID=A0A8C9DXV8_PHOSS